MKPALISGIFLLLLIIRIVLFFQSRPIFKNGENLNLKTTLLSEPQIVRSTQRLFLDEEGNKIYVITSLYPQFHYADTINISGTLRSRVINNKQSILTMYYPEIEPVKNSENSILAITSIIRQKLISFFEKNLPSTSSSLLLGIVFGIKESFPKSFFNNLRISGVLHVIAASGMNVTMTAGFLSSIFGFFFKRQTALVLSIFGILFYAILSGLEASIIRASIMGILAFSAQILGRQRLASYGLLVAGYTMVFVSPIVILDVGFQLSFIATAGLLYIKPLFERKDKIKKIFNSSVVGEGLITTVSAQIATLPILLANFGIYSVWSIVVNALVLWTVPILMVLGGAGAIFLAIEAVGKVFLYLSLPLLIYFEWVVNIFSSRGGVFKIENVPWQFTAGYYFVIAMIILLFRRKEPERTI